MARRPAPIDLIVTMDDATSAIYSAFLTEEEGTASTFRALKDLFSEHGLPMSLYTDRGAHYFHTPKAGGEVDRSHPTQVGRALEQLGIEHIGAYSPHSRRETGSLPHARTRGWVGARVRASRIRRSTNSRLPEQPHRRASIGEVYLPAYNVRFAIPAAGEGPLSRPFPASISTRSCASRRSARSAMTIASPTARSSSRSRKARCAPISSGRGSRSTSTPTARTPSSTGRAASAATTKTERSEMRKTLPKSARRRACGRHGQASGLPTRPQENKSRRSGHMTCCQNRTT